jgi:hypothetical protein
VKWTDADTEALMKFTSVRAGTDRFIVEPCQLAQRAAAEIERLRARVAELEKYERCVMRGRCGYCGQSTDGVEIRCACYACGLQLDMRAIPRDVLVRALAQYSRLVLDRARNSLRAGGELLTVSREVDRMSYDTERGTFPPKEEKP